MSAPKTLSAATLDVTLSGLINAYGSIGQYPAGRTIDAAVVGFAPNHFTVQNTGTILSQGTSQADFGLVLGASGTVFNTGTIIAGSGIAIFGTSGESSLSNTGKIFGTIGTGIYSADFATLSNSKYIFGQEVGVQLAAGGLVENLSHATIAAGDGYAIESKMFATIGNAGTLHGERGGIILKSGGTIVASEGVSVYFGGTFIDTGTIDATGYAISFASGFANRLVLGAGADIEGTVNGGGGTLELAPDGTIIGTVSTDTQAPFTDFGSFQIDAGGTWDFAGAFTIATAAPLLNNGTIKESAHDTLVIDSALTGTGAVELSKTGLTLNDTVVSTQKISFSGTGATLDLGDPTAFHAKIEKFALGDTIDLTSISLSAIISTHFSTGVLILDEKTSKLEIMFANPSTFGKDTFKLTAAGQGTAITLAAPAALPPPTPVTPVATLTPLTTFA